VGGGLRFLFLSFFPFVSPFFSEQPCTVAGLFTTNAFEAPPVTYDKALLAKQTPVRGVVINTRIANACTGDEGMRNAKRFAEMAEEYLSLEVS
jgi:glutamate N-acetyltransferase/amino-acid N-acetyltransferase